MSEECTENCRTCAKNCSARKAESLLAPANSDSNIKKVIAVISGKGGVGKSMVTSMLAVLAARRGKRVAILDADVTGPSIPKIFGITEKATSTQRGINPVITATGIKLMSVNLLLEKETDPVIWRGPIIAGTVRQFWTDVVWGEVDLMLVDCPPGTGDVPLTIFQSLPVDGVVIVTSPQELVRMVVEKAVGMAGIMHIPVLGIVENMSYFECPDCGGRHNIFGDSNIDEVAGRHGIENIAKLPLDPKLAGLCDRGEIEIFEGSWLDSLIEVNENK